MELNDITDRIISSAIKVHKALGPGLLESAYEACLLYELRKNGLNAESQVGLPLCYDGVVLYSARLKIQLQMNRIVDWIFSIRLTGDMNIAGRRSGKIQPQDIHRKAVAIFRVWIRTLRGLRYPGIGSLSEYEPILKIFAIYS